MSTSQQTDPLIGRLVDSRYRVRARIARGGMATVYVATDLRLERRVALKVMHGHLSDDTVFQNRFIQEARSAARLADPHVVNVFDQGQDGEMAYLVMEYLPGITLRELLREQKRLTLPQTITIMDAILAGLSAAHRAGIVHRDVKPENVLLAEDGRIKIGDFGLARATSANTATGQMLLGTIAYLAPELVTRGTADARSDIYALGIMLYEMLAGEQPYKGEQPMQIAYQHATHSVPRPSVKNPGVPEQLDELVLWATERNPEDRPTDAREMLERLREIQKQLGVYPQVVRSTPAGGTVVIDDSLDSDEVTRVMPGTFTAPSVTTDVDNATRLRRRSHRNAVKGAWILAAVLLLAAAAGGVGWWFGSGPGSLVAVPDVRGMSFEEAAGRLAEDDLVAARDEVNSLDVAVGEVVDTDPGSGARVDRAAEVTVRISAGPATTVLPTLQGREQSEVEAVLADANIEVDAVGEYFTSFDQGQVVRVYVTQAAGGEATECTEGCEVLEGSAAELRVSLGPVPDVAGLQREQAQDVLSGVDLRSEVSEEFSETVDTGRVIALADRTEPGSWKPGDTVTLIVSKGPQLFAVPDVTGLTLSDAAQRLRDEGFTPTYQGFWNAVPDGLTEVESTDPPAGEQRRRGSEIALTISLVG
ncbi:Stk1 family PASTA domain-containing Ser/Thr kinase [Microbacterium sp. EYE_5]|uniref:Stk1 family PASTA domain-containing Ser/Thr kinase n=1 Tax=unclassified Microbacterium TaxID=2609290 RepID=UPI002004DD0A|nr:MULTISPECIES: Stk1 family PASTA domain-containing Ser/Thr kinase [unclassified Microbacterium]MCK6080434.1 Stk1 family PASTA domain-containing Ser/Thr kinase [Microbacterium sp. EYE_382]MCK6085705.1 Stk1 family PASTA domain-containing Ser/Thr kinase [Microbacterium sp. EYE_384]MCK6124797.1 Stk1 family PASTA domain-containing Ser/Thr kinase [Microbacterium sp. EYE_80]MCK6127706.1 Stk1 family PASTA domain-containing Ser/Thr kinase [Microbacterium sp. EYE_79]MCK6141389.1 Stk1 family PASTA doma